MPEFDDLIEKIFRDNEERRIAYGMRLADIEDRLQRAEEDALKAHELRIEAGTAKHCGMDALLAGMEQLRAEVNAMWVEIEKPAPDWTLFPRVEAQ